MLTIAFPQEDTFLARVPFDCGVDERLKVMDQILEDPRLILRVTNDLARSAPQALWNGRPSTPVVVTLRGAVVRRLLKWSYRTLEDELRGSARWRWFCRVFSHAVPDHSTLRERESLIRPRTLQWVNDRLVALAEHNQVTRGKKLRSDGTVIETNIHYPTDSRLLCDSVRVLGRVLSQARQVLCPSAEHTVLFRNRQRQARRLAHQIANRLRAKKGQKPGENKAERLYRKLVQVTETTVARAEQVLSLLEPSPDRRARALADTLRHYLPLVRQVIRQTQRRVLDHQPVPAAQKVVSLFEPHTAIIRRGKSAPHETEFGGKVWYSEVDGGVVSEYRLLQGNPPEARQWEGSLQQHERLFHHPPEVATADRGVFSPENERLAQRAGIAQVALPQPGAKDEARQAYEAQPWFKAALRFRSGIEGRISGLRRARGLDRCLNRGRPGLERWLGWGVITNNLVVIADCLTRRHRRLKPLPA